MIDAQDLRYLLTPKCPHCATEIENWWETVDLGDGDRTAVTCDECGKEFFVETMVEYRFNSAADEGDLD